MNFDKNGTTQWIIDFSFNFFQVKLLYYNGFENKKKNKLQ